MALVLKDRVLETCTSPGTGTITLLGAVTGYQAFSTVGNGNTCYYAIADQNGANWECGIGTYSSGTLARTTVLSSSNAGSLTNFSTGSQNVFLTYPSERSVNLSSAALTSGRVTYATTDGLLTDSANLVWDNSNTRLGIATSSPIYTLDVNGDAKVTNAVRYYVGATQYGVSFANAGAVGTEAYQGTYIYWGTGSGASATEKMRITNTGLVGIGTSSPQANLQVTSSAFPVLKVADGVGGGAVALGDSTISSNYVGIWRGAANSISGGGFLNVQGNGIAFMSTDNVFGSATRTMTLDNSGNLGLGVTPSAWFSIDKALQFGGTFSGTTHASALTSQTNDAVTTLWNNAYRNASVVETYFATGEASKYRMYRNAHEWYIAPSGTAGDTITFTQAMTLDASGNLGVGTTSPTSFGGFKTLELANSSGNAISLVTGTSVIAQTIASNTNSLVYTGSRSNHSLVITTSDTERMRLDTSGNLGLGVTPSGWSTYKALEIGTVGNSISGGVSSTLLNLTNNAYYNSGWKYANSTTGASLFQTSGGASYWYINNTSGTAGNAITFTQAMTLDASGNLLVGTTSVPTTARTKGFAAKPSSSGGISIYQTDNVSDWGITATSGSIVNFYSDTGSALTYAGAISVNGVVTTYGSVSDYRLKENIVPMTGALAKVAQLKPVTYKWKLNGSDGQGFIAHELAEVVPDCVTGKKDAIDEDGKPKYQAMDTSFLVATLTAAIQELKAEFDAYKTTHP